MDSQFEEPFSAFHKPPLDYSLTYLDIIDHNVTHNPRHPVFLYLKPDGSIRTVTWKEAGAAFYNAARIIQAKCNAFQAKMDSSNPVVVGILANTDSLTYICTTIGIMLAGFVPFPISNRNSPAAVAHLLRVGDCKAIIISQDHAAQSQIGSAFKILKEDEPEVLSVVSISVPTYEYLFENTQMIKMYAPLRTLRDATHDSLGIIIHSSGSVSFPKPINISYRMLLQQGMVAAKGELYVCGEIFGSHGIPIYHALGMLFVTCCFTLGMTLSLLPPNEQSVLSPDLVLTSAIQTNCTLIACVPSFIENWAQDKRKIEMMKRFKAILYGGGPLSIAVGDMLVKEGINIVPLYGTTEAGAISRGVPRNPPSEDWEWMQTAVGVDIVFVPTQMADAKNVYRLVVKTNSIKTLAVSNTTIDNIPAYDTNDLMIRHPTNPLLWKVIGREDDQIIHSTGEKTNPTPIEGRLLKDPRISSAIVFGRSKFQPGVLVLPSPEYAFDPSNQAKLEEYRNLIWETVEKANEVAPQHSRIFKEFILVANPSKPFEFTAKGTARRHAVLKAYDPEIEKIYQASESQTLSKIPAPVNWELAEVRTFLRTIVASVLGNNVMDSENIFLAGGDSLAAVSIRNTIMHALRRSKLISHSHLRGIPRLCIHVPLSGCARCLYLWIRIIHIGIAATSIHRDKF
ncbi:hypothetical protein BDQ17DRAFT_887302 [Cyathus striatus]|nr:hypothetical protein BDQ17DRAFT_887302 [Cyathus striatus]